MNDFQCKVQINADPKKVYEATSEQHGLANWWTSDCDLEPKEGTKATFRFGETYTVMLIEKLIPHKQIRWKCVDHRHMDDSLTKHNEWVNTNLIFDLKGSDGGTELAFTHQGLNEDLQCYQICQERWSHFLKKSLKSYLETGQGEPYNGRD